MDSLKHTKGVLLEPKPSVVVSGFGESSVDLKIKAWVSSTGGWVKIKSNLAKKVKDNFDKHGITIPWPIRTIAQDKDSPIEEKEFVEEVVNKAPETPEKPETPQVATPVVTSQTPVVVPQEVESEEQPLKPLSEQR